MNLLQFTDKGIYCPQADVYLDPWKPVSKALITHGHADHAKWGSKYYLCTTEAKPVIQYRLNTSSPIETIDYGKEIIMNGVRFSFHPAGHIIGSAQIRVEYNGEVWVFSGDYKIQDDGLSGAFEPIRCHTFITESTFGLPIYKWKSQPEVFSEVNDWWRTNKEEGKVSVLAVYALGKAQRILTNVDRSLGKIVVHGAIDNINTVIRQQGIALPETHLVGKEKNRQEYEGALVLCPPSAVGSSWIKRFTPYSLGVASGWMRLRGTRRRRGADRGFAISDHADWEGLNWAVKETGAERVFVTHGYSDVFSKWLNEQGINSSPVTTQYDGELPDDNTSADSTPTN